MTASLLGRRVLLIRPADKGRVDDPLLTALRAAGAQTTALASTRFAPPADEAALTHTRAQLEAGGVWDWAVFTSPRAVAALAPATAAPWPGLRVAAVGPVTAAALGRAGQTCELALEAGGAAALGRALAPRLTKGARVLLPLGNLARSDLADALVGSGALAQRVEAYRTFASPLAAADLAAFENRPDVILFTSGSGAAALLAGLGEQGLALPLGSVIACLGPRTARDLAALGLRVDVVIPATSGAALVAALAEALAALVPSPISTARQPRPAAALAPPPRGA
ncbi:MAG TPA: uroporphyrinogen-III synthase [Anaerolineae bacterium]|nr:uroporphyrinogen-III synthase [Ardenticatenia bacterium]HQZ70961.1 uroporphyrinogen-III synthase [Anaerolineae bacterium]HRA18833.1 uroporphyrinogen-III synthase [Anaerolineae bacterium]